MANDSETFEQDDPVSPTKIGVKRLRHLNQGRTNDGPGSFRHLGLFLFSVVVLKGFCFHPDPWGNGPM